MTADRPADAAPLPIEIRSGLPVLSFASLKAWEDWLALQPPDASGLWLKFAKKGSGLVSLSRAEAIEGALCQGWIDGQIGKFDASSWLVRFTPRRRSSKWSQNNCTTATSLIESGRMRPSGLAEIERARADGRWAAAYPPQSRAEIPADLEAAFEAAPDARAAFTTLDAVNRYAVLHRIHSAKKPETRERRIANFVAMLERGETIYPKRS